MIYIKNEAYLDAEEKFYDYRTKTFNGKDPFDTTTTGVSFYNQLFTDPDYMRDYKNLTGTIEMVTPQEYFYECSKLFGSTVERLKQQTSRDSNTIQHLNDVLKIHKRTFPVTMLNYAGNTQEGMHRMFVVGELLGWDTKFPVLCIDFHDKQLEKQREQHALAEEREKIISRIQAAVKIVQSWYCDDVETWMRELRSTLERYYYKDQISIFQHNDVIKIKVKFVEEEIELVDLILYK